MVALNRLDELKLHVRAALQGGVSRSEIQEVLLQSAVYCGVPAARAAFEAAAEVLAGAGTVSARPRTRKAARVVRKGTR
jgi:alkylhydroperoxidase/carboxymuconolactone decarboxylase family protein YurZ